MRQLFNLGTLNIFTDASVKEISKGRYISCAGCVCVITKEDGNTDIIEQQYSVIDNATNNKGELCAVYMGVMLAIKYRYQFNRINIISDSQFSIFGLTKWIYNWRDNIKNNNYISNSSKSEVSNQDLFKLIINTIILYNLKICLYHQKGHSNTNDKMKKARQVFFTSNGIKLDDFELKSICYYNDIVDKYTKYKLNESPIDIKIPIQYNANFNVSTYSNLIDNNNYFNN